MLMVLALKPVLQTQARETDHLVHLQLGGERIATTVEHRTVGPPFWVADWDWGWKKAGELQLGDGVLRADGAAVPVTEISHQTEFDTPVVVYNIEVAEWHTYLVGKWQWWVHNATICLWTAAKAGTKYAQDILRGIKFNKTMEKRMADGAHELWVDGMKYRLDTLIPGKKIISRKATQLGEVSEQTAKKYIDELVTKYEKGKTIQNPKRAGGTTKLEGDYTLQIPRQDTPIPQSIKDYARAKDVTIEEVKDLGMSDLKNW